MTKLDDLNAAKQLKDMILSQARALYSHENPTPNAVMDVITSKTSDGLSAAQVIRYTQPDSYADWQLVKNGTPKDTKVEALEALLEALEQDAGDKVGVEHMHEHDSFVMGEFTTSM